MDFNRLAYGPAIAVLLDERLPALGAGTPNEIARPKLIALALNRSLAGAKIVDFEASRCVFSGLWLWHDFLEESHHISQDIDSAEGSYWHAIMHRREPDYGNAKYWFRRMGQHGVFGPLAAAARELAGQAQLDAPAAFLATQKHWDAFAFVELCEAIARGRSRCEQLAREIARAEWRLLFDHCYRQAIS
jgi:hypothetical protein